MPIKTIECDRCGKETDDFCEWWETFYCVDCDRIVRLDILREEIKNVRKLSEWLTRDARAKEIRRLRNRIKEAEADIALEP